MEKDDKINDKIYNFHMSRRLLDFEQDIRLTGETLDKHWTMIWTLVVYS